MKKKEINEIKNKDINGLKKLIADKENQIVVTILETKLGKIKNVHLVNQMKKDIARLKTILTAKQFIEKKD